VSLAHRSCTVVEPHLQHVLNVRKAIRTLSPASSYAASLCTIKSSWPTTCNVHETEYTIGCTHRRSMDHRSPPSGSLYARIRMLNHGIPRSQAVMSSFRPVSSCEHSPAPASTRTSSIASAETLVSPEYRGFASKDAYLEALRVWVEEQMHFQADVQMTGFYGKTTMEEYKSRPGLREDRRARKEAERRQTLAKTPTRVDEESQENPQEDVKVKKTSNFARRMFGRRATTA